MCDCHNQDICDCDGDEAECDCRNKNNSYKTLHALMIVGASTFALIVLLWLVIMELAFFQYLIYLPYEPNIINPVLAINTLITMCVFIFFFFEITRRLIR